ncbi:hypothetical protein Pvag_0567 [Pantoea vagans C9-1]|nr:hypothetical protein Pvag_0567 [Pantoea vagans C9-1]
MAFLRQIGTAYTGWIRQTGCFRTAKQFNAMTGNSQSGGKKVRYWMTEP